MTIRRIALFSMLVIAVSATLPAAAQIVYATSSDAKLVSAIDPSTNKVASTLSAPFSPGAIATTLDGKTAYVVNTCSAADQASGNPGSVTVFDLVNDNVLLPAITVGNCPNDVVVGSTPNGMRAYVSNRGSGSVSVIDLAMNMVTATIPNLQFAESLALSPDGSKLYVAGAFAVIDTTTNQPAGVLPGSFSPSFVAVDPASLLPSVSDGSGVYFGANFLSLCGSGPLAFMPTGGRAFAAESFNGSLECGTNEVDDISAGPPPAVTATFPTVLYGNKIAISADGSIGYVGGKLINPQPRNVATGTATLAGHSVGSVRITNGGSGYTGAPAVLFGSTDVDAIGQGQVDTTGAFCGAVGCIYGINFDYFSGGGSGYLVPPIVQFVCTTPGGCSRVTPAAATVTISNGSINSYTITNPGAGYVSFNNLTGQVIPDEPLVLFRRQGFTQATGFATISNGVVSSVVVTNGGSGYGTGARVAFECGVHGASCGGEALSFNPNSDTPGSSIPVLAPDVQGLAIAPTPPANTPASGSSVPVSINNNTIQVTFQNGVTQAGRTTAAYLGGNCPAAPGGFQFGNQPICYDINTTAAFPMGSTIQVCITDPGVTANSTLQHFQGGMWTNVTTSVDATNHIICGSVQTFSPLAIFQSQGPTDTTPPHTMAAASPPPNAAGWNNSNVSVSLNAMDNAGGSGVARISYAINGTAPIILNSASASFVISSEGINTITYFATDNAGNVEAAHQLVIKLDKTAPIVSCSTAPSMLWPPNHKLVKVATAVNVQDSLSGPAGFELQSITSNEPDSGRGDIVGWNIGTPDVNGQLRAERLGSGNGRTYTLEYLGFDIAGNSAPCVTQFVVPHDQGNP
jgi:YVTN family beta-propeller protein